MVKLWYRRWEIICIVAVVLLLFSVLWIRDVILSFTYSTRGYVETLFAIARFTELIEFPAGFLVGIVLWFLIDKKAHKHIKAIKIQIKIKSKRKPEGAFTKYS